MKTLNALKRGAAKSTHFRGHRMKWEDPFVNTQCGECIRCHKWVILNIQPMPNGIEIAGSALALNCHTGDAFNK